MPALILPVAFTFIFLSVFSAGDRGIRRAFIEALIVFSLATVAIT
jgi:hypothetical protein